MSSSSFPPSDFRAASGLAHWQLAASDQAATDPPLDGPGVFEIISGQGHKDPDGRWRAVTKVRSLAERKRRPGSVLIGVAAWLLAVIGGGALYVSFSAQYKYVFAARHQDAASIIEALLLDLLMIVFTLLALGLSRAGKSSRAERALILACAAASAYMNVSAADTASPRSVVAYAVAPIALAMVVDRVVAVIRRHVLADEEASAWTVLGRALLAVARFAGLTLLYSLRFTLDAPETARGLRQMVLDAAPLPDLAAPEESSEINSPPTKKAVLLDLYRAHPDYGKRAVVARAAAELAPAAGLQANTARSYLYAELKRMALCRRLPWPASACSWPSLPFSLLLMCLCAATWPGRSAVSSSLAAVRSGAAVTTSRSAVDTSVAVSTPSRRIWWSCGHRVPGRLPRLLTGSSASRA
jgi:Protein of unknown function (DUF2637)